jgi:hypothetical protein
MVEDLLNDHDVLRARIAALEAERDALRVKIEQCSPVIAHGLRGGDACDALRYVQRALDSTPGNERETR